MSDTAERFLTACRMGDLEKIKMMYENGEVNMNDDVLLEGYEIACQQNDDLVRYMMLDSPHETNLKSIMNHRVNDACEDGDLERAQYYASLMQICDQVYEQSTFTYILCCGRGYLDIIRWLHSTTCCGSEEWKFSRMLGLRDAVYADALPVVQWLLENEAFEQDAIDTAFRHAASNGSSGAVSVLLQHGVSEETIMETYSAPVREDDASEDSEEETVTSSVKDAIALYIAGKKSKKACLH